MSSRIVKSPTQPVKPWPWKPWQTFLLTIAAFVLAQLVAGFCLALAYLVFGRHGLLTDNVFGNFLAIVLAEGLLVWLIVRFVRAGGIGLERIGFARLKLPDLWLPAVALVVYFGLLIGLVSLLQVLVPGLDTQQKQDIGFKDVQGLGQLALVFLALVVAAPIAEETLFRGFLYSGLRQRYTVVVSTLLTSLLFGAAHLSGGEQGASLLWIAGIDTMLLSITLCYLREKTGRLWAPILLHAMKNCVAFLSLFVFTR